MRTSRLRRIERIINAIHEPQEKRRARITAAVDQFKPAIKRLTNVLSPEIDFGSTAGE